MPLLGRLQKIETVLRRTSSPQYTRKLVLDGVYKKYAKSYEDITSLSKQLRQELSCELGSHILNLENIYEVVGDQAHKVLFETGDKSRIETVRMTFQPNVERASNHYSLCISSQSGCALGCAFCATGAIGFKKNLSVDEITDQILYFKQNDLPIDSVSFMGMGEPFANPNIFEALKIITDKDKLGVSPRKLSVSTVGLIPGIVRLGRDFPEVNLAFSLHSPFADQRLQLMPITKTFPIKEVMNALRDHIRITNKKVFISYVLLAGVNDSKEHAQEVVRLIRSQVEKTYLYHVNLIRFNPGTTVGSFGKSSTSTIKAFQAILNAASISNTLRESFGVNISAACGQLYGKYQKVESNFNFSPADDRPVGV